MIKHCPKCGLDKDIEEFHKNPRKKDGLADRCKECRKEYHKEHYEKNKQVYIDKAYNYKEVAKDYIRSLKKELACEICKEDRWWVLDFHHKDPEEKDGDMSRMMYWSKKKIDKELDKCMILCSNCHRDLHHKETQAEQVLR